MKRSFILFVSIFALVFSVALTSCSESKPVDKRALVKELVAKGDYQAAKAELVTLRGQYPNDQTLTELNMQVDEKLAESFYEKYFQEAEAEGTHEGWIKAMIKIKKVENINKDMVNSWIKKATEKCIDTGAKKLSDEKLIGLLNQLFKLGGKLLVNKLSNCFVCKIRVDSACTITKTHCCLMNIADFGSFKND